MEVISLKMSLLSRLISRKPPPAKGPRDQRIDYKRRAAIDALNKSEYEVKLAFDKLVGSTRATLAILEQRLREMDKR